MSSASRRITSEKRLKRITSARRITNCAHFQLQLAVGRNTISPARLRGSAGRPTFEATPPNRFCRHGWTARSVIVLRAPCVPPGHRVVFVVALQHPAGPRTSRSSGARNFRPATGGTRTSPPRRSMQLARSSSTSSAVAPRQHRRFDSSIRTSGLLHTEFPTSSSPAISRACRSHSSPTG